MVAADDNGNGNAGAGSWLIQAIDYSLLFTFAGFFIFIGNLTQFDFLNIIRDSFLGSATGTYFSAIAVSQLISNVPAAMLLAAFSQQREALLLGSMSADWEL